MINGCPLIKHKKSGYYNEANKQLLSGKCFYCCGDGFSEFIKKNKLSKYIMKTVRGEICLDVAAGVGGKNGYHANKDNYKKYINKKTSILDLLFYIIQSNTIKPEDHRHNLPNNVIISHADKVANVRNADCVYSINKSSDYAVIRNNDGSCDIKQKFNLHNVTYCKMIDDNVANNYKCGRITVRGNLVLL